MVKPGPSDEGSNGGGAPAAPSLKEQGNALFKAKNYLRAAAIYTQAIKEDPENHALYSNRSAAFLHLSKVTKALADAEMAVKLKPDWDKGYFRKGCALESMKRYEEAVSAFQQASALHPQSSEVAAKLKLLTRLLRDQRRARGAGEEDNGQREGSGKEEAPGKAPQHQHRQGEPATETEERVQAFAKDMLDAAKAAIADSEGNMDPSATFLESKRDDNGKEKLSRVLIKEAFESPDTWANCTGFLRQHVSDTASLAGCLIVPRRRIAFPQVWNGRGAKDWRHGERNGLFLQLEAPKLRRVWFIAEAEAKGEGIEPGEVEELDIDTFALLQPLFR